MKKVYFLPILLSLIFAAFCVSCSNDDEPTVNHPSYRDGTFKGDNLTVTLNGEPVASVKSATMTSRLLESNANPDKEPGVVGSSDPTYLSTIRVDGFPSAGVTTTLETVSDLLGFCGEITIKDVTYNYLGEFTGDPLMKHEHQGLILSFTEK